MDRTPVAGEALDEAPPRRLARPDAGLKPADDPRRRTKPVSEPAGAVRAALPGFPSAPLNDDHTDNDDDDDDARQSAHGSRSTASLAASSRPREPATRADLHLVRPTAAPWTFNLALTAGDARGRVQGDEREGTAGMAAGLLDDVEDVLDALAAPTPASPPMLLGAAVDMPPPARTVAPALRPDMPRPTKAAPGWAVRPGADEAATLDVLERLHPEDLRSLADVLRQRHPTSPEPADPLLRLQSPPRGKRKKRRVALEVPTGRQRPRLALRKETMARLKRQATQGDGSGPSAQGYPTCTDVGNAVLSCYPEAGSQLVEGVWSKMIWNNNYPTFIGSVYVDLYLYNADSEQVVANWTHVENNRGMIGILPQDSWFPTETSWTNGQNVSTPYFFVIVDSGSQLTGAEQHQATFTVVQTAAPSTLIAASLSSASAAAASSFASALSSFSAADSSIRSAQSAAGLSSAAPGSGGNGPSSLQGDGQGSSFPHWAIAVIVILGVLALLAALVALYFVLVSARRKRELHSWSDGSRSPMMRNGENAALVGGSIGDSRRPESGSTRDLHDAHSPLSSRPGSPLSAADLGATGAGGATFGSIAAAAGTSKRDSAQTADSRDGPITSDDAERMADAFRNALRKPAFPPPSSSGGDPTPDSSNGVENALAGASPGMRQSMQAQLCDAGQSSTEHSPPLPSRRGSQQGLG